MPTIKGTTGNKVTYEVLGVAETLAMLRQTGKDIQTAQEVALVRAATFLKEKVQDSIAGKEAETKSVDTGKFLKSVEITGLTKNEVRVASDVPYGQYLEYGTSKLPPRAHFGNTAKRNKQKIVEDFGKDIKVFAKLG